MMLGRGRFGEVVSRQLDLFADSEADGLLSDVQEQKRLYDQAPRDDAEEAYGDYQEAVDAFRDALAEMRDRFAETLDGAAAEKYETEFEETARRRWRWLA